MIHFDTRLFILSHSVSVCPLLQAVFHPMAAPLSTSHVDHLLLPHIHMFFFLNQLNMY